MKFTNQEAFEKLKGMLTKEGKKPLRMSEKSLTKQIETLLPLLATEETELDDFVGKVLPSLEVMNSNAEFDKSESYKEVKKEFEEKYGNPNPKPNEPKQNDGVNTALEQRLAALEAELANTKREKALGDVRTRISNGLIEKGVKDKEWIAALMSEVSVTEDIDVDAKVDSLLKFYNKTRASVDFDVTPSGSGSNQVGDKQTLDFFGDIKKEREAQAEKEKGII